LEKIFHFIGSGILALFASEAVQNEGLQHKIVACEALPGI